jgi:RNA polymerase-binding protein DksA
MAGVRGRIGAALRRAGDVSAAAASASAAAASKLTSDQAAKAAASAAAAKAGSPPDAAKEPTKVAAKAVVTKAATAAPGKKAPAKKAPAKKAPAKKAPAKKAPAKKAPAEAAPASQAAAKTAAAMTTPITEATASRPSGLDPAELTEIRARLQAELAEMQLEYEKSMAALSDLRQYQGDGAGDDQADAGSKAFERDQEQSIAANRHLLASQIEHAIERIDSGTYGICEDCGRPIPAARLKALPMATLDADCKTRAERR